ncbi:MAG: hypothetical protein P0Y66_18140 [Candidatus Kaistia colombiensis]|nr:MAG: hypothetical protein P0Y66_18140 [Kaistia sp.]
MLILELRCLALLVEFMSGHTTANGPKDGMMAGIMPGNSPGHGARDTANSLSLYRSGERCDDADDEQCAHGIHPASAPLGKNALSPQSFQQTLPRSEFEQRKVKYRLPWSGDGGSRRPSAHRANFGNLQHLPRISREGPLAGSAGASNHSGASTTRVTRHSG